jgi:hypothetical protein
MLDNGWSLYGAQRSQLVATSGKWEGAALGSSSFVTQLDLASPPALEQRPAGS